MELSWNICRLIVEDSGMKAYEEILTIPYQIAGSVLNKHVWYANKFLKLFQA
jgi:hypothetical protein